VEGNNVHNDWWDFEAAGRCEGRARSGRACDFWNRYGEDFRLWASLGHGAHRLSIEWSRIEPEEGRFDEAALDHYRAMLDSCAAAGLRSFVTLHHFTLPRWVAARGGFLAEGNLPYFERFVARAGRALSDRVHAWNTINEPAIYAFGAYLNGEFPPAHRDLSEALTVYRNLLLAHARAWTALKAIDPARPAGLVKNMPVFEPRDPASPADRELAAARDALFNGAALEGLAGGRILIPPLFDEPCPGLRGAGDFLGVNYYFRVLCDASEPFGFTTSREGERVTDMGWGEYPDGLRLTLHRARRAGMPLYVTENGIATADDARRRRFLREHLAAVHEAIEEGCDVRGYFHWSSMDNFEWAKGFRPRFGLIGIDRDTLAREPRPSAMLFADIARRNAIPRAV
jgi:beta-glucosidase